MTENQLNQISVQPVQSKRSNSNERMLLHACCGPCSLEPSRVLREKGKLFDIYFANPNIAPDSEYDKRLQTLRDYWECFGASEKIESDQDDADDTIDVIEGSRDSRSCDKAGMGDTIAIIEGSRDPRSWDQACGQPFLAGKITREQRCRACYRLRFEESAKYASEHGYASLGTTLSVSPYQYTKIIKEELEAACERHGVQCEFEDYRPYYDEATRRSREAGMYRQNYCGCSISAAESEAERAERREQRRRDKAKRDLELADVRAEQEARLEEKRKAHREYSAKRARQNEILRTMRMASKEASKGSEK